MNGEDCRNYKALCEIRPLIQPKNCGSAIGAFQGRTITTEAEMSFEAGWPAR